MMPIFNAEVEWLRRLLPDDRQDKKANCDGNPECLPAGPWKRNQAEDSDQSRDNPAPTQDIDRK